MGDGARDATGRLLDHSLPTRYTPYRLYRAQCPQRVPSVSPVRTPVANCSIALFFVCWPLDSSTDEVAAFSSGAAGRLLTFTAISRFAGVDTSSCFIKGKSLSQMFRELPLVSALNLKFSFSPWRRPPAWLPPSISKAVRLPMTAETGASAHPPSESAHSCLGFKPPSAFPRRARLRFCVSP